MEHKSEKVNIDTRVHITEDEGKQKSALDGMADLTERQRKCLEMDIKEPDSMARDLLIDRYTKHLPKFQDFAEAVNFIINTAKYMERIEALMKYERYLFFRQRPDLQRERCRLQHRS